MSIYRRLVPKRNEVCVPHELNYIKKKPLDDISYINRKRSLSKLPAPTLATSKAGLQPYKIMLLYLEGLERNPVV